MTQRCTVNDYRPQSTTLPTRPPAADVRSTVARALMSGGSDADLRALVVAYTRVLRDEGLPPEQALVCVKRLIAGATTGSPYDAFRRMRADAISMALGSWFVAAYFRAD